MTNAGDGGAPAALVEAVHGCIRLLDAAGGYKPAPHQPVEESLPSLLDQCADLIQENPREPIRMLHHFACTGGTLLAKCLASMPNTSVLSEVEPYSTLAIDQGRRFFPTDLIQLLRVGTYPETRTLIGEVFLRGLSAIVEDSLSQGLRLVLRDHAHSRYCSGLKVLDEPPFDELISARFPTTAVVLVRNPVDSYLSLVSNKWLHFEPATFPEYCVRYLRFLEDTAGYPVHRYEDFVARPLEVMSAICKDLELPYTESFMSSFSLHKLSGDSGRSSSVIAVRERRPIPDDLKEQIEDCGEFLTLCNKLGYST